MKSNFLKRTLAVAIVSALAPAYAQMSDTPKSATSAQKTPSTQTTANKPAPAIQSGTASSDTATQGKPLCSTLNHPNAGKLADKDTGLAKENSASPVHMDCIPDSAATASDLGTGSASGAAGGVTSGSTSTPSSTSSSGSVGASSGISGTTSSSTTNDATTSGQRKPTPANGAGTANGSSSSTK